ncbi:MAG: type II toxin-antitoxin system VapC family toxin [Ignavibacteriae bacterium]|nr:type II toxin-antitoxin system VapC family toxin [Ignavibacteriota bacterium]
MPAKPKAYVLDSWAIIAYYEDEPAGEKVANLLVDANEHAIPLWMSVVNAGEVWYTIARRTSSAEADATINELHKLGIQFDNAEWKITRQAAVFKSKHKMSYADAFSAALALQKNAHLITGDKEFKEVEDDVKIHWL